jgi:hypothetical protein
VHNDLDDAKYADKVQGELKEAARGVWTWWQTMNAARLFLAWCTAVRIVVLIPMSSAFVERVFSQAALVRSVSGDSMLHDQFELRVMARVNKAIPLTISGVAT